MPIPRKDFISDNLVHMRDRLKENAERVRQETAQNAAASETAESAAAPIAVMDKGGPAARLCDRVPMRTSAARADELERMRRELEGRLTHDAARTAAELELTESRREALRNFSAELEAVQADFDALDPELAEYGKQLERLRGRYFVAAGRAAAFRSPEAGSAVARALPAGAEDGRRPMRELLRDFLPVVLAVLTAGLLVAGAILAVFL